MVSSVFRYETLDSHHNFSDHIPLKLTLNIDVESLKTVERNFRPCVAWHKCNDIHLSNYRDKLDMILLKSVNPNHDALRCMNKNCTEHTLFISELYNSVIKACIEASEASLPHNSQAGGRRIIPGWKEHVQEHADRAKLWHEVWLHHNKPRDGIYANLKQKSRMQYHYAIRSLMKDNIRIRNIKMAEAISLNNDRELWEETRKMTRSNNSLPVMMDGHIGADEISNIFLNKYDDLYNSVGYNPDNLNMLKEDIKQLINSELPNHMNIITVNQVKVAINMLKTGKKEENGLFSNHFKYGSERLVVVLTLLFNCILLHGIAPDELLLGTMIPLIKNSRGNKQCSDNYRALTIGTSLSKLLDIVILNKQTDVFKTSNLQFGFKEKSSTTMCTYMVLETIDYFKSKGSNVHALMLDASKAFDRVNYVKLFKKLIDKGMCPLIVRLLLNMYTKQSLQVKWDNVLSPSFHVTNGVRQGGVLSPLLFSIYVDDLLERLKQSGVGCHIGHIFVGAFGYADDLILLSPSLKGLKSMIKICEDYANDHDILFNGKKSNYLIFGDYKYNPHLYVNNEEVSRCESALYLGHKLSTKDTNNVLVEHSIKSFKSCYHNFMSKFSTCNTTTKDKLFNQYCSSMYGSQLWLLNDASTNKMLIQWRKAHRIVLSLPIMTHCDLLPLIADNLPLECMLESKFISFYKSVINSDNDEVRYIANNCSTYDISSRLGRNVNHILSKYGITRDEVMTMSKHKFKELSYNQWLNNVNPDYFIYSNIIKDMLLMKEDRCTRSFTNDECTQLINFICSL